MNPLFTSKPTLWSAGFACFVTASTAYAASSDVAKRAITPEEVVVTSQFRDSSLLDLAATVSVFDAATIEARGANNIEQLLNLAPNVNFSSGALTRAFLSDPRYWRAQPVY